MAFTLISKDLKELPDIAKQILEYSAPKKKFLFYADMGVGKTTLIKELSLHLGVSDIVSSPTFSIVNEYKTCRDIKVYHFDFYRIEDEKEALDIGYEEYISSDSYCFIEWPEKISNLIEEDMVVVKIKLDGVKRVIEIII